MSEESPRSCGKCRQMPCIVENVCHPDFDMVDFRECILNTPVTIITYLFCKQKLDMNKKKLTLNGSRLTAVIYQITIHIFMYICTNVHVLIN